MINSFLVYSPFAAIVLYSFCSNLAAVFKLVPFSCITLYLLHSYIFCYIPLSMDSWFWCIWISASAFVLPVEEDVDCERGDASLPGMICDDHTHGHPPDEPRWASCACGEGRDRLWNGLVCDWADGFAKIGERRGRLMNGANSCFRNFVSLEASKSPSNNYLKRKSPRNFWAIFS